MFSLTRYFKEAYDMAYADMREFLADLERAGELKHVKTQVDKDWEISTLTRKYFLQLPAEKRPALFFDNVKGFDVPVVVSVFGNRRRYAMGLGVAPEEIGRRWVKALDSPIPPELVKTGPCKENIMLGKDVDLLRFPIPIWTPGKDVGPYITAPGCVSRDPETGQVNVGTYRLQVKGKNKTGLFYGQGTQHIAVHHLRHKKLGRPMEVAVVLGSDPYISMVQVTKVPQDMDEYAAAGGLKRAPIELVKCETIDLEVPATSEIVIEGEVPADIEEPEAPFGETSGFMSPLRQSPIINIKAITYRNNPVYHSYLSQKPPSESTNIKCCGAEGTLLWGLKRIGVPVVKDLYCPDSGSNGFYIVVSIEKMTPGHPQRVCNAIWSFAPNLGKYIIVCDDDIDIRNPFDVEWALTYRCDPVRDTFSLANAQGAGIDPTRGHAPISGKMGLDATIKQRGDYELALPDKEYFDKVEARWQEYGLE
jgi:UbiD family decarboxylase